jgi:plastocyanin
LRGRFLLAGIAVAAIALIAGAGSIGGAPHASAANTLTLPVGGGVNGFAANDFFPDSITIHAGDTVHFMNPYNEIHTATFEPAGTASPDLIAPGPSGPPQFGINPLAANPTFSGTAAATFDSTKVYNTGILQKDSTADLIFPGTGTFTFICLVHGAIDASGNATGMVLTVKVVATNIGGADTQASIDARGSAASAALINQIEQAASGAIAVQSIQPDGTSHWAANIGLSITDAEANHFQPADISIKTGDTIDWTNVSGAPHTVTFTSGAALPDLFSPLAQPSGPPLLIFNPKVFLPGGGHMYDGTGYVNSGFLQKGTPLGTTFALTFTKPGTYKYACAIHADQGMTGTITVTGAALGASATPAATAPAGVIAGPNTGTGPEGASSGTWLPALIALAAIGALTAATGFGLARRPTDR